MNHKDTTMSSHPPHHHLLPLSLHVQFHPPCLDDVVVDGAVPPTGRCLARQTRVVPNGFQFFRDPNLFTHPVGFLLVDFVPKSFTGQRCNFIQERMRVVKHALATDGVVLLSFGGAVVLPNHVGAVQTIVQGTPSSVGGVQGVPSVVRRDDQLWPSDGGDFGIHVGRLNGAVGGGFGQQIPNVEEERFVGLFVGDQSWVLGVVLVDLSLQGVSFGQGGFVFRTEHLDGLGKTGPKLFRRYARPWGNVVAQGRHEGW